MIRKLFLTVLFLFLLVFGALLLLKFWSDAHFFDGYDASTPLNALSIETHTVNETRKVFGVETKAKFEVEKVFFEARPGELVPTLLTFPLKRRGRLPVIVLLHGSHQEKEFVEDICTPFTSAGFAMVCFDQHMRGERKVEGGPATMAWAFRERTWKTVHDTRRLIDYLQTRKDIDSNRVYLVGASYGAITGTTVVAQEPRIRAAVLVVGGANLHLLAKAPIIQGELPSWLHPVLGPLITFVMGAGDPIHTASGTSGTPILMQNGENDGTVIPEAGKALFEALGTPKSIRWYPIDHPDREENGAEVHRMLREGLEWLKEKDTEFKKKPDTLTNR